ncbi:hypothetical protein BBF96_04895 [Anoxybacter fermentans]|uniref:DUF2202 domain-containing protein n=1 Tax=Anoxybacter fermentans TaxID=1323375 RepID=A0A3S9SWV8_9FIRM|nr:DUF2202 domain-containing protein [Anoxybacter fermentans]AZR72789.1 hypothetical protein BBF96_04895 [Anoxybacter fermentans]
MNKKIILLIFIYLFTFNMVLIAGNKDLNLSSAIDNVISSIAKRSLSESERDGIILMREEEKLTRDVYLKLYEKWSLNIFQNIAKSEITHMGAVALLINRYELEDPVKEDVIT